jgi:hypothetical protein
MDIDPVGILGALVWTIAAGMWPVAIMLGSSCSPCCTTVKVQCRCVRYEQQTHDATPNSGSSYYAPVTHGWSAVASAPRDAGIRYLTTNGFGWQFENSPDPTNARQWQWLPPRGDIVTDSTRVHNFWLGTETLSYVDADNKTILVRTEDWSEACGQALCQDSPYYRWQTLQEPYAVFRAEHPKRSAVRQISNSSAACAGAPGASVSAPMRLGGCRYVFNWNTCAINGVPEYVLSYSNSVELNLFYCGDLLWAIENGPCRSSMDFGALNSVGVQFGSVTLTDDAGTIAGNRRICFNDETIPDGDGKCHPAEATVSINNPIPVYARLRDSYYSPSYLQQIGTLSGDYVCQWQYPQDRRFFCFMQDFYSSPITFSYNGSSYYLRLLVKRRRQDWTGDRGSAFGETLGTACLPWNSGQASSAGGTAEIDGSAQTLAGAAISFSAAQDPMPKTITADTAQIAPEGQTVTYTYCCDNFYTPAPNYGVVQQTTPQTTIFTKTYPANNTLGSIFWLVWKSDTVMELEQPPQNPLCKFGAWAYPSMPNVSSSGDTITVPWAKHEQGYDDDDNFYSVDVQFTVTRQVINPRYPTPACALKPIASSVAWISPALGSDLFTASVALTISTNTTGQQRTGTVTIPCGTSGVSTWTVIQQPQ